MRWAVLGLLLSLPAPGDEPPQIPIITGGASATAVVDRGLYLYGEGDYEEAAASLKLVALTMPHVSAAADVALGEMYEHGLGVPQDILRAYALYLHAGTGAEGSTDAQLLGRAALTRLDRSLSEAEKHEATSIATSGFREGLVPQFLPLRSGGVLALARDHVAVTLDGETRVEQWGEYSMWFEHVSLREPGSETTDRDLLEVLFWRTGTSGTEFERRLAWRVYAIARGGLGIACEAELLVVKGYVLLDPTLPAELRARARLGIRGEGELTCEPGVLPTSEVTH